MVRDPRHALTAERAFQEFQVQVDGGAGVFSYALYAENPGPAQDRRVGWF